MWIWFSESTGSCSTVAIKIFIYRLLIVSLPQFWLHSYAPRGHYLLMEEVQKYEGNNPFKKKKKSIWFHHLVCITLWLSKGWCKASNHSCPIYSSSSGVSDGLVGANFSQDHDLLLEEKWCCVPWGHLQWQLELIWHFVCFVLAICAHEVSLPDQVLLKKTWEGLSGLLYRREPKSKISKKKKTIQEKNMRWMGTVWGDIFCSDGVTRTPHLE